MNVYDEAVLHRLRARVAGHDAQHGEALARLDAQRGELRDLLAQRNSFARQLADLRDERDAARTGEQAARTETVDVRAQRDRLMDMLITLRRTATTALLELDYTFEEIS